LHFLFMLPNQNLVYISYRQLVDNQKYLTISLFAVYSPSVSRVLTAYNSNCWSVTRLPLQ
jgi:hypothetical protein